MPYPERVETERLLLRRPEPGDLPALQAVIGDPRIDEERFPARFRTPELTAHLLERMLAHWDEHGFGPWVVLREDELIGRAGLSTSDRGVEALWFLSPDHWGRGYATEATRPALEAGFADLGLKEIVAWTMPTNLASQAVMRRLGFVETGPIERAGLPHVAYRATPPARPAPPTRR